MPDDLAQHAETGEAVDVERRLAICGAGELLDRTVPRDLAQRSPEHFIGALKEIGGLRKFCARSRPMPTRLGALTGEKQAQVFLPCELPKPPPQKGRARRAK